MTNNTVHYMRRGAYLNFEFNGIAMTYLYYSKREAYRLFKQKVGIKRAKLVEDRSPITYGFIY